MSTPITFFTAGKVTNYTVQLVGVFWRKIHSKCSNIIE